MERDNMGFNIAVERIATNWKSTKWCFRAGLRGNHLDKEYIVWGMFERSDTAIESIKGIECTIPNDENHSTPPRLTAVARLLPE